MWDVGLEEVFFPALHLTIGSYYMSAIVRYIFNLQLCKKNYSKWKKETKIIFLSIFWSLVGVTL